MRGMSAVSSPRLSENVIDDRMPSAGTGARVDSWGVMVRAMSRLLQAGLLVLVIAACSAADDGLEPIPGWEEPGWMAQVRQQDEEFQSAMIACYDEYNFDAVRSIGGGSIGFIDLPADPATQELFEQASTECNARVPLPEYSLDTTLDDAAYERTLELRECIIAHGYDVEEPPSAAVWKDSGLQHAWSPYQELLGRGVEGVTQADLRALTDACPQPGPNTHALAPTDGV